MACLRVFFLAAAAIALFVPWTDPCTKAEEIAITVTVACACVDELQAGNGPNEAIDAVYQGTATKGFRQAKGQSIRVLVEPIDRDAEDPKFAATTHLTFEVNQSLVEYLTGREPPLQVAIATVSESDPKPCAQQKQS